MLGKDPDQFIKKKEITREGEEGKEVTSYMDYMLGILEIPLKASNFFFRTKKEAHIESVEYISFRRPKRFFLED